MIKMSDLQTSLLDLLHEIEDAEKYQFVKPGPGGSDAGSVKIDILTGPQSCFQGTRVRTDARRARPSPSVGIHAHPVDEAPTLEGGLLPVTLVGKLSSDEPYQGKVEWCGRRDLNPHGFCPLPPQDSVSTNFHHFRTASGHLFFLCPGRSRAFRLLRRRRLLGLTRRHPLHDGGGGPLSEKKGKGQ